MISGPRIVSLIPSATEIVAALGLEENLVGRSHECDFPSGVGDLPVCTAANLDTLASSAEIDRAVKSLLGDALSIYKVEGATLKALRPDLIVTQDQCDVCAVSLKDVEAAVCDLLGSTVEIVALRPNGLEDVFADIGRVARAAGGESRGTQLVADMRARMAAVSSLAAEGAPPTVAYIEWIDPLMAAGNWMPELVEVAGGRNLFGAAGLHSPWMTFKELAQADPDVIVVLPCGFDLPRSRAEMGPLIAADGWRDLKAVTGGRVAITDGNQYFNRPGPRLAESVEILAEICHPDQFDFGHRGSAWEPL